MSFERIMAWTHFEPADIRRVIGNPACTCVVRTSIPCLEGPLGGTLPLCRYSHAISDSAFLALAGVQTAK